MSKEIEEQHIKYVRIQKLIDIIYDFLIQILPIFI